MTVQRDGNNAAFEDDKVRFSFLFDDSFDYVMQNPRTREIWIGGGDVGDLSSALDYLSIANHTEQTISARAHFGDILDVVFAPAGGNKQRGDGDVGECS